MSIASAIAGLGPSRRFSRAIREMAKQDISTLEANGNFAAAGVLRRSYSIRDDEKLPPPKRKKRRSGPGRRDPDALLPKREPINKSRARR